MWNEWVEGDRLKKGDGGGERDWKRQQQNIKVRDLSAAAAASHSIVNQCWFSLPFPVSTPTRLIQCDRFFPFFVVALFRSESDDVNRRKEPKRRDKEERIINNQTKSNWKLQINSTETRREKLKRMIKRFCLLWLSWLWKRWLCVWTNRIVRCTYIFWLDVFQI